MYSNGSAPRRSALLVIALLCTGLLHGCAYLARASESETGLGGNDRSLLPALSSDGRWTTFASDATNLVPGDTNGQADVFVRDNRDGTIARVSLATDGSEGDGPSGMGGATEFLSNAGAAAISANGRFVAFDSYATNLVAGDVNGQVDVFRRDRDTDADGIFDEPDAVATQLVSASVAGAVGDSQSLTPKISDDGSVVAFVSGSSNLLEAPQRDTNDVFDVYAATFDLSTGQMTHMRIISRPASGIEAGLPSFQVDMNSAGTAFAFTTDATNMVPNDTNGVRDVIVNTGPGTLTRATGAVEANAPQFDPSISDNGFVAYVTGATNLAPGDTSDTALDVFVTDLTTGTTTVESRAPSGVEADGTGVQPTLSADATRIAFVSGGIGFIPGDAGGLSRFYVRDRVAGRTQVASTDATLALLGVHSFGSMSRDGRFVAYFTTAGVQQGDVFVRAAFIPQIDAVVAIDTTQAEVAPVLHPGSNKLRVHGAGFGPGTVAFLLAPDGTTVTVTSVVADQLDFDVSVAPGTASGSRSLFVGTAGPSGLQALGAWGACTNCVTVSP